MHETDLVRSVAQDTRLSQRIVGEVLTAALAVMTQALSRGQTVVLPGFGTFYTKDRKESLVRNIRHPEEVLTIPAMRQADFRVGDRLRQAVRRSSPRGRRRQQPPEAAR